MTATILRLTPRMSTKDSDLLNQMCDFYEDRPLIEVALLIEHDYNEFSEKSCSLDNFRGEFFHRLSKKGLTK